MKKVSLLVVLCTLICLLTGCKLIGDSYVSVREHYDPYAYTENTEPAETEAPSEETLHTVRSYYELLGLLREFVTEGVEHGQLLLTADAGAREEVLSDAFYAIKTEDPVGAYAIDYLEYEHTEREDGWLVTVDAVYRRSVSEIEAIRSVRGNERALSIIYETLDQLGTSVTLQISGFQDEDFGAKVRAYCLEHPNTMVQLPEISASIYPESGNVRVVELHFAYHADRESLRSMQAEAQSVLLSAERYAQYAPDDATKLSLIYAYLTSRFTYAEDGEAGSVYRLLCEGVGNSESFAAVTAYLCRRVGLDCQLVEGQRLRSPTPEPEQTEQEPTVTDTPEPAPYAWNIVCIDGVYYHVDVQQDALDGAGACRLLLDEQMSGYTWDREQYPICNGVPIEEKQDDR